MKIIRITAAFLLCGSVAGCGSALKVKPFDPAKPAGVPFFVKQGACNHTSAYGNPYWRLTLKVSNDSGALAMETLDINNSAHGGQDFNGLLHELEKAAPDQDSVMNAWDALKRRDRFDPWKQNEDRILIENSSAPTSVVDYSTKYAINQSKPFSGSSNVDFKLSPDGTLNEANAQVQDNTFSTIVSALPISSLITSAAGIATKAGAAANEKANEVKYSLAQEQRYIKTVYSQMTVASQAICTVGKALTETDQNIATSIVDVGMNSTQTEGQDKNSDSITVSGTIKLPKSSQAVPPANGSTKEQTTGVNGITSQTTPAPPGQAKPKKN